MSQVNQHVWLNPLSLPLPLSEPPTIVMAPNDTVVSINSTVIFVCVAYGYPFPNISWQAGSERLENDTTISITTDLFYEDDLVFVRSLLQLCGVTVYDEGDYSCVAENSVDVVEVGFSLNVLGESLSFSLSFSLPLSLSCRELSLISLSMTQH